MLKIKRDGQCDLFDDNPEYAAFVDKFKPKKTTDDCYTPEPVYEAVADWVAKEFGLEKSRFLRPFYPGGDYEREDYPEGCVVVDNPPFSILAKILRDYESWGVPFFLFAPALTLFSNHGGGVCYFVQNCSITYANGAVVTTSFVSNLDRVNRIRCDPELYAAVKAANEQAQKANKKPELPKYVYPDCVATAAGLRNFAMRGVRFAVPKEEAVFVRALDAQKRQGKALFGSGFLLSSHAAAERAAAERAAAERAAAKEAIVWLLSERERMIVKAMDERAEKKNERKEAET